jgi:hypothetical protein
LMVQAQDQLVVVLRSQARPALVAAVLTQAAQANSDILNSSWVFQVLYKNLVPLCC